MMKTFFVSVCCFAALGLSSLLNAAEWQIQENPILTPWAEQVSPVNAHPEYPRPQFERHEWVNLNGLWDYAIVPADQTASAWDGQILVPYPIESALSGVKKTVGKENLLVYHRTFTVPAGWKDKDVILNFEACDWKTEVSVNGKVVGNHTGGYAPFSFNITGALKAEGEQEVTVTVYDPTDENWQPRGKQVRKPGGIWYTSVTGLWGTVWMEPVAKAGQILNCAGYAAKVVDGKLVPAMEGNVVIRGAATVADPNAIVFVEAQVRCPKTGEILYRGGGMVKDGKFQIAGQVKNLKYWSPENPVLYPVTYTLSVNQKTVDSVESYIGLRTSTLGKDGDEFVRMLLNGKFLFQYGPLDQGWWPDGLYTAPTDEALKYDLEATKQMGFNMLRKHVKVEPRRFYYWCDKLGMMVWQDMPSGDKYIRPDEADFDRSDESTANYYHEWGEIMETLQNSPSIVMWVPFNEGWGQFDTEEVVAWTMEKDPTRLCDCASGWSDRPCGSVHDMHRYPGPGMPEPEEDRAVVLGEFGGLGLPFPEHAWKKDGNWGYVSFADQDGLRARYKNLIVALRSLIDKGLSAAVYTQTTDVEVEVNGLMTYDRKVNKMGAEKVAAINARLYKPAPKVTEAVPVGQEWAYTTDAPAENWFAPDFDASAWKTGKNIGGGNAPNVTADTEWKTPDVWVRRTFELGDVAGKTFALKMYHDEDAEVYVNGVKVLEVKGYVTDFTVYELDENAGKAFKTGKNTISIHCRQTMGGQYIDCGVVTLE